MVSRARHERRAPEGPSFEAKRPALATGAALTLAGTTLVFVLLILSATASAGHPPFCEGDDTIRIHLEAFAANPVTAEALAEGFRIALVDLRRVCAAQPMVFTDTELASEIDPDDLEALAAITLRPPAAIEVPADYDKEQHAWILTPPNPNFRILDEYQTSVRTGTIALGSRSGTSGRSSRPFGTAIATSSGRIPPSRCVLVRGISVVPPREGVSTRSTGTSARTCVRQAFLGRHAPLMPDYLDDDVSAGVDLPNMRRVIMIQAQDFSLG